MIKTLIEFFRIINLPMRPWPPELTTSRMDQLTGKAPLKTQQVFSLHQWQLLAGFNQNLRDQLHVAETKLQESQQLNAALTLENKEMFEKGSVLAESYLDVVARQELLLFKFRNDQEAHAHLLETMAKMAAREEVQKERAAKFEFFALSYYFMLKELEA